MKIMTNKKYEETIQDVYNHGYLEGKNRIEEKYKSTLEDIVDENIKKDVTIQVLEKTIKDLTHELESTRKNCACKNKVKISKNKIITTIESETPKKRGRKPKVVETEVVIKPKKRGRKPKAIKTEPVKVEPKKRGRKPKNASEKKEVK